MYAACKRVFEDNQGCLPVRVLVIGRINNNCYIVSDGEGPDAPAMIIDPAGDVDAILTALGDRKLQCIYATHRHNDHVLGLSELVERTGAPVFASAVDAHAIEQGQDGIFSSRDAVPPVHVDYKLEDGDEIVVGRLVFKTIFTPGHTEGCMCLYLAGDKKPGILFSGDVLFKGTTGRVDFPGGDENEMRKSLRDKLSLLPDDTIVYPGHGDFTTIGDEREPVLNCY